MNAPAARISTLPLNGRQAFAEVELRNWPQGLYFVQLLLAGHQVATTKFTVLR